MNKATSTNRKKPIPWTIATSAHNCSGLVIAQAEKVVAAGRLDPRLVKVPGLLVDVMVVQCSLKTKLTHISGPARLAEKFEAIFADAALAKPAVSWPVL